MTWLERLHDRNIAGRRAARQSVIIEDHRRDGPWAATTRGFMGQIGNAHHGVALPQNDGSEAKRRQHWAELGLRVDLFWSDLNLYPPPFGLLFDGDCTSWLIWKSTEEPH